MHASHSRRVAGECVNAAAVVRIPYFQRAIGAARNDDVVCHLRRPHAAGVADKRMQAFARDGRPYFQCIVIGTGNDAIAAELQTSDDVIVVRFENFRITNGSRTPIRFDDVLPHVGRLPQRRHRRHCADSATFRSIG